MYRDLDGDEIRFHPHAFIHGMNESEILFVWNHPLRVLDTDSTSSHKRRAIGLSKDGNECEVAALKQHYGWYIVHADASLEKGTLKKMGGKNARRGKAYGRRNRKHGR